MGQESVQPLGWAVTGFGSEPPTSLRGSYPVPLEGGPRDQPDPSGRSEGAPCLSEPRRSEWGLDIYTHRLVPGEIPQAQSLMSCSF